MKHPDYPLILERNGKSFSGKINSTVNIDGANQTVISDWGTGLGKDSRMQGFTIIDTATKKPVAKVKPSSSGDFYYDNGITYKKGHSGNTITEVKPDGSSLTFLKSKTAGADGELFKIANADGSYMVRGDYPEKGIYHWFGNKDLKFVGECYGNKLYNGEELVSEGVPFHELLNSKNNEAAKTAAEGLRPLWEEMTGIETKLNQNVMKADKTRIEQELSTRVANARKALESSLA